MTLRRSFAKAPLTCYTISGKQLTYLKEIQNGIVEDDWGKEGFCYRRRELPKTV